MQITDVENHEPQPFAGRSARIPVFPSWGTAPAAPPPLKRKAIAAIGPRRAGKTTFLWQALAGRAKLSSMKATFNVPDELYRRVKAKSALEGRAIREVTIELYRHWVEEGDSPSDRLVSAYELMKETCGMVHSHVGDLSTNPQHMEGFGRDSGRHR